MREEGIQTIFYFYLYILEEPCQICFRNEFQNLLIKHNIRRSINLDMFSCVGNHEFEHKNIMAKGMTRRKITNSKKPLRCVKERSTRQGIGMYYYSRFIMKITTINYISQPLKIYMKIERLHI
jgi:hypothetical protein